MNAKLFFYYTITISNFDVIPSDMILESMLGSFKDSEIYDD